MSIKSKTKVKKIVNFPKLFKLVSLVQKNAFISLIITGIFLLLGIMAHSFEKPIWVETSISLWSIFTVLLITILGGYLLLFSNHSVKTEESLGHVVLHNIKPKVITIMLVIIFNTSLYFWNLPIIDYKFKLAVILLIVLINIFVYSYVLYDTSKILKSSVFHKKETK